LKPPYGGVVARAAFLEDGFPACTVGLFCLDDSQGVHGGQRVFQITEVKKANNLFRTKVK
jgi:hypothetical protein